MRDRPEAQTHPSYGQVVFSRITGGCQRLYGSPIPKHGSSIRLTISHSEMRDEYNDRWYYGRKEIITVELSAAQFAELLTTMNVGSGVCCTIKRMKIDGKYVMVEDPPHVPFLHEEVAKAVGTDSEYAKAITDAADSASALLKSMLERKGALRRGDAKKLMGLLSRIRMNIASNLPYVLDRYSESMEKIKTTVMAEADAWLTNAVNRAGLKALKDERPQLQLEDDDE